MPKVKFYKTLNGKSPVEKFLDSLNDKQARKIVWVLKLIKDLDFVPKEYLKKLVNTEDIWEVRVQLGNDIFRILGFFEGFDFIVLTNGFQKKSQKTPAGEIALAEKRKTDYLRRRD